MLRPAQFRSAILSVGVLLVFLLVGFFGSSGSFDRGASSAESAPVAGMRRVGLRPGDLAPDFALPSIDGVRVSLSDFRGHSPVLLNLWTVSCPYCHLELDELKSMYDDYKGRLTILSVSVDPGYPASYIKQLAVSKGLPFTVLVDQRLTVARLYSVSAVPANYLIDEDGIILGVFMGVIDRETMKNKVEPLLQ